MNVFALLAIPALLPGDPLVAAPFVVDHAPRVLVEAPSEVVAGSAFRVSLLVSRRWGPEGPTVPSAGVRDRLALVLTSTDPEATLPATIALSPDDEGRAQFEVTFRSEGLHRVIVVSDTSAADGAGEAGAEDFPGPPIRRALITGESNPVRVLAEEPPERIFWGDLHAHLHTPGAGHAGALPPDDFAQYLREGLEYGRDVSRLDFAAFTPHIQTAGGLARPSPGSGTSPWREAMRVVEETNAAGSFVVFPGFEWQGDEGDHCVIYPAPRELVAPASFLELADSVAAAGGLLTAHGIYLPTRFEPRVAALVGVEVTRDTQSLARLGREALRHGIVPAFLGCSDTHGGALGATSLTGLRAATLSREGILDAIRARKTWATTGERIVLEQDLDVSHDVPTLRVHGTGTGPLEAVEIFRNGDSLARLRGFDESLAFDFDWEDDDLLRLDCLDGELAYHAELAQTTANRYDASRRDVAITSPLAFTPQARHFDAAYTRRGGSPSRRPGAAIVRLRNALRSFRPAPDRPLRADPPAGTLLVFRAEDIESLRAAVDELTELAAGDRLLSPLARLVSRLPDIAEAFATAQASLGEIRAAQADGPPDEEALRRLRGRALSAHALATSARGSDREERRVREAWFAARMVPALRDSALAEVGRLASLEIGSERLELRPVPTGDTLRVLVDPRLLAAAGPVSARARELRRGFETHWGYTAPSPVVPRPALGFRATSSADLEGAKLLGRVGRDSWEVPLTRSGDSWLAMLDNYQIPGPGEPPIRLLASPAAESIRVSVESPDGRPLLAFGRVSAIDVLQDLTPRQAELSVGTDSVQVLVETEDGAVWQGVMPPGKGFVPVPPSRQNLIALPSDRALVEPVTVRWGFAGWARRAGSELSGHDFAQPSGLGALADGRAAIAFPTELVVVDPETGETRRYPYPDDRRHEPGRELCIVPLSPERVLVRGAEGPGGGWARVLGLSLGAWGRVPRGPESGTVAAFGTGGYAWLTGTTLSFRTRLGFDIVPVEIPASGRLLGFDPLGRAVVRTARNEAVRVDLETGEIVDRVRGRVLGHDPGGALLLLEGFEARHPELAREVHISCALPDGSRVGPFPIAAKASAVLDPPVSLACAPDGDLYVLSSTTWWRREPEHDWWGAVLDRWEPVWAGQRTGR